MKNLDFSEKSRFCKIDDDFNGQWCTTMIRTRRSLNVQSTITLLIAVISANGSLLRAEEPRFEYLIGYMGVGTQSSGIAHVLGFIKSDGTDESYPDFGKPDQKSWVFGPMFADGRRVMLTSYEDSDVTKVRSGQVTTRNWIYDLFSKELTEIAQKDRLSAQVRSQALLPGDQRIIMSAIIGGEERLFMMDLDGGNRQEITEAGGGFHYAVALNSDQTRLACHVTGGKLDFYNPGVYSINVIDLVNRHRVLVAGKPNHLYFGPRWSPDDRQLVYMDCQLDLDPEHFRSGLCIGQADGSGQRVVTPPQGHWFGTPYGSNIPEWTPDGETVTYTRLLPKSERDMSHGGSQICLINVQTDEITELTSAEEGRWDFRTFYSPDGKTLLFTRVQTGGLRELWAMDPDGSNQRRLTKGYQEKGADFSRWLRVKTP